MFENVDTALCSICQGNEKSLLTNSLATNFGYSKALIKVDFKIIFTIQVVISGFTPEIKVV